MSIEQFKLTASNAAANAFFGSSASAYGGTAIVGAHGSHAAYVFVRSGGMWTEQATLLPSDGVASRFGSSVAVHGDTVVVGAPGHDKAGLDSGAAYIYVRGEGSIWTEQAMLIASDAAEKDNFGKAVTIHGDTVIVGTQKPPTSEGAAYVFVRSENPNGTVVWEPKQILTALDGEEENSFGAAVAIQGDVAVIGAPFDAEFGGNAGAAYVFVRDLETMVWVPDQKLTAIDPGSGDVFGVAVALSGDTTVVGASTDDTENGVDSGSAYVFVKGDDGWAEQQKLVANTGGAGERFGISVAIDGNTAVIGAIPGFVSEGGESPDTCVYRFVRDEGETNWTEEAEKLVTGSGFALTGLNDFVSISGCTVIVGTNSDDDAGSNAGAAYAFLIAECPCVEPVKGLVSWWTLDQLSSPSTDSVGGNHGVWFGDPIPVPGMVDGALRFDGTQHVEIPHDPTLNLDVNQGFTIDAWIKPLKPIQLGSIVDKRDSVTGRGYSLRLIDGRLAFLISDGANSVISFVGAEQLPLANWSFVAITVDRVNDVGTVYVNDDNVEFFTPSDSATDSIDNTQPLFIANSGDAGDRYEGVIDEVEIFNRALTSNEITLIRDSLKGGKCKPCVTPPEGLVAWWPFDEREGSIASDIVGGNDGTYNGSPTPANGKIGMSLSFFDNDQWVKVVDHPSLNFDSADSFSIDCWVRLTASNVFGVIVEKWEPDSAVGYRLFHRSGTLIFAMSDGSTTATTFSYVSLNTLPFGAWRFLTVTVDRDLDIGHVYVNGTLDVTEEGGVEIGSGTFVPSATAPIGISNRHPMFIGGNLAGEHLGGRIDELEIYRRSLTETEINDLFIAGTAGKCKPLAENGSSSSKLLRKYLLPSAVLAGVIAIVALFLL